MIRMLICLLALSATPAHAGLPVAGNGPTGVHIGNPTGAQDEAPVQVFVSAPDWLWAWWTWWA